MKQLPKQLTYLLMRHPLDADIRRGLSRRTADDLARIVYSVTDSAQPMPHVGIVLKGRTVVGWIMSALSFEDQGAESEGDVTTEYIEFFVPDPKGPAADVLTCYESPYQSCYPELCRVRSELTAAGSTRDRREYDSRTTGELVKAVGLIEVIDNQLLLSARLGKFNPELSNVLVPARSGLHWEPEYLSLAKIRACQELRPPAFWNMPAQTTPIFRHNRVLSVVTVSPYLLDAKTAKGVAVILAGAIRFEAGWFGERGRQLRVVATRVKSGEGWRFELRPDLDEAAQSVLYPIQAGATALSIFEHVFETGQLPAPSDVQEAGDAKDAFDAMIFNAHQSNRRLQFVLDALDIDAEEIAPRIPLSDPVPVVSASDDPTLH